MNRLALACRRAYLMSFLHKQESIIPPLIKVGKGDWVLKRSIVRRGTVYRASTIIDDIHK